MDRQKRYVEAIGQFNKVIAREPANPQAYDCVALDLDPMSQIERADAGLPKGPEGQPRTATIRSSTTITAAF